MYTSPFGPSINVLNKDRVLVLTTNHLVHDIEGVLLAGVILQNHSTITNHHLESHRHQKKEKYQTTAGNTNAMTKSQNYFTEIGVAPEQCHELKVYIKCMILPGAPAFECNGLGDKESKKAYHQRFKNALEEIGPRIFPQGGKGLARPEDYVGNYITVHEVVQLLCIGIGDDYGETDNLGTVERKTEGCYEMEMTQDCGLSEGESAGHTDLEEIDEILDEEIAQDEHEDQVTVMSKDYNKEAMEQGHILEFHTSWFAVSVKTNLNNCLLKPEAFAHFASLAEGCFDWDEVAGSISPDSVPYLANLDHMRLPAFSHWFPSLVPRLPHPYLSTLKAVPPLTHFVAITMDLSIWGLGNVLALLF
ncbi:hypothetical protein HOY82DRAFT_541551 [Tuber indicum]|nr:hypothetical protein HOY82DRAFT_541551 [Tuber indicum]